MLQMPSSAAACDAAHILPDPLRAAAEALADRSAFGVLWVDPALSVVDWAGAVPDIAAAGIAASDVLIALLGLEDELDALKDAPRGATVRIPNTAIMASDGTQSRRMNVSVYWVQERSLFLVLLAVVLAADSPTLELDQEIRRRRLVEQDLAAKSLEYARINQQLEEFAYVISHDLNAPLRALRYLSGDIQRVLEPHADDHALNAPAAETVDFAALRKAAEAITSQSRRMSRMMTDLLEYARIGRVQEAVALVETRVIIEDIIGTLRPTTTLALEIAGEWPTFETVATPLDIVLRNLIENAVKHHDRPDGRVSVHAALDGRFVVFRVVDDGRGIPPEWHQAVFEPFRKVDDAHHPESSGIGLALVKKAVTTLGGTIEIVSEAPEVRGATFIVKWPLKLTIPDEIAFDLR
jgi:signal transduction histidine kinase